ncbi:60S ribosomal protein L13a [Nosema bombycis CQ1]|uniref:60S ribosomal protein L13a n=2 Tax=Nosema bombycis TaxID=27978 RepID=R0KWS4_NOSB1|nr:60S ribosomal protein L13a [Nosema bombycis]EOB15331.1 60S ribosomal protein L13a [Nosema bombycis CQ1]|eukprot:EOB15331.1 60S ribosomal protein L13a [Nosema bombycis CQ1]
MHKHLIVDASEHVMGKLASKVAKLLLEGHKITVLNCEKVILTGSLKSRLAMFKSFLNKRCRVNPRRGPFHHILPSMRFYRTVRGMIPYKSYKGKTAISNLAVHEGIPVEFTNQERHVFPRCLHKFTCTPLHKNIKLQDVLTRNGWKHLEAVDSMTEKVLNAEKEFNESQKIKEEKINEFLNSKDFESQFEKMIAEVK